MRQMIALLMFLTFIIAFVFMFQTYPGIHGYETESLWTKAVELVSVWFDAQIQNYKG